MKSKDLSEKDSSEKEKVRELALTSFNLNWMTGLEYPDELKLVFLHLVDLGFP